MAACVSPVHMAAAMTLRKDQARLDSSRDLIAMGAYAPGRDPALDAALAREISLEAFLAQKRDERAAWPDSLDRLLAGWGG